MRSRPRKDIVYGGSEEAWLLSAIDEAHFESVLAQLYLDDIDGLLNDSVSPEANRCPLEIK